ncbi:MAG: hypothetical protein AAGG02_01070 [Cyanobacteria bacterium P01_H01_bin.15]
MAQSFKPDKISVGLPWGIGTLEWTVDETEQRAAWSLYVELVTRIAVQPLPNDQGLVREALTSLYKLFETTRETLKEAGPQVGAAENSVGGMAIAVLNKGLRPFLSRWHPLLQSWEESRGAGVSPQEHEKTWAQEAVVRQELETLRGELSQYCEALAIAAGVSKTMLGDDEW